MIRSLVLPGALFSLLLVFPAAASAQVKQRVKFPRGTHSTSVKGGIRGYAYRDHVVGASAGQMMRVRIDRNSGANPVFSIFRPDGEELGTAAQTNSADEELPVSGDYVIRVGMMRSDARRRGSVSTYTLSINIQ